MRPQITRTLAAVAFSVGALAATAAFADPLGGRLDPSDRVEARLDRMAQQLDLSDEQRQQIQAIFEQQNAERDRLRAQTRQQVDAVLTDAQRAKRDELLTQRLDRRLDRMAERLDLSADQKERIRAILAERKDNPELTRSEIKDRIAAVLTDEQKGRFEAASERRWHHGRGGRSDGPCGGPGKQGGPDSAF